MTSIIPMIVLSLLKLLELLELLLDDSSSLLLLVLREGLVLLLNLLDDSSRQKLGAGVFVDSYLQWYFGRLVLLGRTVSLKLVGSLGTLGALGRLELLLDDSLLSFLQSRIFRLISFAALTGKTQVEPM
ncbi:hypothetical protein [Fictibacillus terranigra]|uniref:Secreted protein n=1 Tax=Fictibacillus terranigra TaxID=3058424 RepID=A0ABT8EBQ6_9BACL|nr:hypothetical protein [Fictibacillus sp. CENA-BCM004]MDN4075277.1 hypothetical protein [Fictibacillus sp. CENA-BCM004]